MFLYVNNFLANRSALVLYLGVSALRQGWHPVSSKPYDGLLHGTCFASRSSAIELVLVCYRVGFCTGAVLLDRRIPTILLQVHAA